MLHIVLPSMGRPQQCRRFVESVLVNARGVVKIFLGLEFSETGNSAYAGIGVDLVRYYDPPGRGRRIWNDLARHAVNEGASYVMLASDDVVIETPDWDVKLLNVEIPRRELPHFIFGNDGSCGDRHATHPFLSASWLRVIGKAMPDCVEHYEGDTFITALGRATGRMFYNPEIITRHMSTKYGLQSHDATSQSLPPVRQADWNAYRNSGLGAAEEAEALARLKEVL